LREVLPNVLPSVLAYFPTVVAALIVAEGSLSFLGLGIPSPTPSWGTMVADGKDCLTTDPRLVFVPTAVLFLRTHMVVEPSTETVAPELDLVLDGLSDTPGSDPGPGRHGAQRSARKACAASSAHADEALRSWRCGPSWAWVGAVPALQTVLARGAPPTADGRGTRGTDLM
jgi:hypothetical protein